MTDSDITRQARYAAGEFRRNRASGEALFEQLLETHPSDGMIFLERAQAHEAAGLLAHALGDYRRAQHLLKYPSWIAKAEAGVNRLAHMGNVPASGRRAFHVPTVQDFAAAARVFREREPRAVVYEAARVLLESAYRDPDRLSPVVGVAALIQSWNFAYYKSRPCDAAHIVDLELALHSIRGDISRFRDRDIATFDPEADGPAVRRVFKTLEQVLGRVGAAKASHVLAPLFFPLWDNPIAEGYGFTLGSTGSNTETYLAFMRVVQQQAEAVRHLIPHRTDVLKALDEYNYCRFSKRWL